MDEFKKEFRLARLYGWYPTVNPREIELYLALQYGVGDQEANLATERAGMHGGVAAPHVLATDLLAFAAALERSLPDIPDSIGSASPHSLFEEFAGGRGWLRELIQFCRGQAPNT